ncbi:MAG: diacylglycerol kinase family protein [Polyangiaceae bacterium]
MTDAARSGGLGAGSVPPASERIAVVVNGNARSVTDEVISTLDQILLGGDLFVSRKLEDSREIAKTLIARGYGTVLTGGGDGTFTVIVSDVIREARAQSRPLPRFGLLKLGTGNALAWVVGASRAKGRGLAADIQRLREDAGSRRVRLVEVDGFLTPFAGFGIDAVVLRDYNEARAMLQKTVLRRYASGGLGYVVGSVTRSLPSYFFRAEPHCRVTNEGKDAYRMGDKGQTLGPPIPKGEVIYEGPAKIAALGSIPFYGFGFRFFPFADEREDRMQLRVSTIGPVQFVRSFRAIWRGEFHDPSVVFDYLVDAVRIEVDPPTVFQIGGDPRGERTSVSARLSPEVLRIVDFYAPPRADDS